MITSYFDAYLKDFNPYSVLTIHPTELGVFGSHTFHELMIADNIRINAFRLAIKKIAGENPSSVWIDIGSGLCPLSLIAANNDNCRKILSIEQSRPIAKMAKKIIQSQQNEISKKIKLLCANSFEINLPSKADVLITETIGNFGLEEGIIGLINDAKKRFLKKDAIIIPSEIELIVAPIESDQCYQRIQFWKNKKYNIDFSVMLEQAANTVYHHRARPSELLSKPKKIGHVKFNETDFVSDHLKLSSSHTISRNGKLHGFIGWFRSKLCDGVFLTNDPLKKKTSLNWTQAFFPASNIEKNILPVKKNQQVKFSLDWNTSDNHLRWWCDIDG